jgi:hypothetical protein
MQQNPNGGYSAQNYNGSQYNNRQVQRYQPQQVARQGQFSGGIKTKHSGCTSGTYEKDSKGLLCSGTTKINYIRGWKYDKRNGLRSFLACPYSKTKTITSGTGKVWENWMVKVTLCDGQNLIMGGMYDVQSRKVIIKDLGFVMNPKGGKGGYVGSFVNN